MDVLRIWSAERAVELVLSESAVTMKLSEQLLKQVHEEINADPDVAAPGWVGGFVRFVTGATEKLLRSNITYALADLDAVEYVDGALRFTYRERHMLKFEDVKVTMDGKNAPILATFAPADAEAFVAAFRTVKAQARGV